MATKVLQATHDGELKIGAKTIPCAVLEDGTRVLTSAGFFKALDRPWRGKYKRTTMPSFLDAKNLKPFIDDELHSVLNPVEYQTAAGGERSGYKAELLPKVCEAYLKARDAGVITKGQENIVLVSDIILRSLAQVGIIALVDEATGYQYDRARKALEEILDQFIAKELRKWAKMFPDEFYQEMFRLRGWQFVPFSVKRPAVVGRYTNDLIYERLAPGVLEELRRKNPTLEDGRRRHKHFQWLTDDIGHPRLREHMASVITLMKASTRWDQFYRMLQRALPKYGEQIPFDLPETSDTE